jgi:hypothetical protein
MAVSAKDKFFSLLFEGERELLNIKFVIGDKKDITEDDVFEAAHNALTQAFASGAESKPPVTGRAPQLLRDALASF